MPLPRRAPNGVLIAGATLAFVVLWSVLGYLLTVPLGWVFGWSGHPAIPDAPTWVYVAVYLVILPAVCGVATWRVARRYARRW